MADDLTMLRKLFEPSVELLGYELLHIEYSGQAGDSILRVYIDAPGGIQVDDCEAVSRQLSAVLDIEDPLKSAYRLEVSSPGLDRPLVRPDHFQRFTGSKVRIVMNAHVLGRRRFSGKLMEVNEKFVVMEVDGESYELAYDEMDSARLDPEF